MIATGVNMVNVKITNRSYVLHQLLTNGPMSRTDIASKLNLTTATLTSICNDFLQKGIIQCSDEVQEKAKVGRKKYPLQINVNYKYIIAIDIRKENTFISITNLHEDVLSQIVVPMSSPANPEIFFNQISQLCKDMITMCHLTDSDILGIGVSIIGPVNQAKGISLNSFHLFTEKEVNISNYLKNKLPFPVTVESNVSSYLNGALLFGNINTYQNILCLKWGPGLGSASTINGKIYKGTNHQSTELGHTFVYPDGPVCQCGRIGCLETGISFDAIIKKINQLSKLSSVIQKAIAQYGEPDYANLNEFLLLNCSELKEFYKDVSHHLAISVNNAIQILIPDKVILYGDLFEIDYFTDLFIKSMKEVEPSTPSDIFLRSNLTDKKRYIGPSATAIIKLFIEPGGELPPCL